MCSSSEMYDGHKVSIINGYKVISTKINNFSVNLRIHILEACKKYNVSEIPEGFVVHHIDGNKLNNDWSNLMMLSLSDHTILHLYLARHPEITCASEQDVLEVINKAKSITDDMLSDKRSQKELELNKWKYQLKKFVKEGINDPKLFNSIQDNIRKIRDELVAIKKDESLSRPPIPTKDELLKRLEEYHNIEKVAKYYKRTSNAILKWCKKYEIDYKNYTAVTRSKKIEKICPVCGKKFTTTEKENKIYCSVECSRSRESINLNMDDIYKLHIAGYSYRKIAELYEVHHQCIIRNLIKYSKANNLPLR